MLSSNMQKELLPGHSEQFKSCIDSNWRIDQHEKLKTLKIKLESKTLGERETQIPKSNTGAIKYTGGEYDPIQLFPEEIWYYILQLVDNPNDFLSCLNTCTLFKKLLLPNKNIKLFGAVFPHLYPFLEGDDLLKCRTISKAFRNTVDEFFENHPSLLPHSNDNYDASRTSHPVTPMLEKGIGIYDFGHHRYKYTQTDLRLNFQEDMQNHNKNPFIGRAVSVVEVEPEEDDIFHKSAFDSDEDIELCKQHKLWQTIHQFLETFGKHIWYINVFPRIHTQNNLGEEYMLRLFTKDLFTYAPNLRSLLIECTCIKSTMKAPEIDINSLPDAPKLESLGFDVYKVLPENVWNTFLQKYCHQLKSLRGHMWPKLVDFEWPMLKEVYMGCIDTHEALLALGNLKAPELRKLGLGIYSNIINWDYSGKCGFDILLEMLNELIQSSKKLHVLQMWFEEVATGYGMNDYKHIEERSKTNEALYAPESIKSLEIMEKNYEPDRFFDYGFLQRFPEIENIKIRQQYDHEFEVDFYPDVVETVEIHKYVYRKGMYESNVWEVLPNLKVFMFMEKVYTRKGYIERGAELSKRVD